MGLDNGIVKKIFPKAIINNHAGRCATCSKDIMNEKFKNELSKKEFKISGMCQKCQDSVFGEE